MLAALLMLLVSPAIAWDVGFQLSALATAGLIWFGAAFAARLRRWPAVMREPVALTWPPRSPPCRSSCSTSSGSR